MSATISLSNPSSPKVDKTDSKESPCCKNNTPDSFLTPQPRRHKRLDVLTTGQECRSPTFTIPASPMMERLGYGTGVGVYMMVRSPKPTGEFRSPWAIKKVTKKIKDSNSTELFSRRLEFEAEILRHLSHPNIIGYRGFGNPGQDLAFLAMEKASKSLGDLIEERSEEQIPSEYSPFPAENMWKVGLDIAKALVYLHEEKNLIHGDLKSGNVLIFGNFEIAKLCDFGVSRKIKEDGTLEGRYVGTEIWNPMEVILESRGLRKYPITNKADIYPYGLTMHEMISLQPPHFNSAEETYGDLDTFTEDETSTNKSKDDFDEDAFEAAMAKYLGKRPSLPDYDFPEGYNTVLEVFYCCTEEDPEKRPSAKQILTLLESKPAPTASA